MDWLASDFDNLMKKSKQKSGEDSFAMADFGAIPWVMAAVVERLRKEDDWGVVKSYKVVRRVKQSYMVAS